MFHNWIEIQSFIIERQKDLLREARVAQLAAAARRRARDRGQETNGVNACGFVPRQIALEDADR